MNNEEIFNQFAQNFASVVKVIVDNAVEKALKNINLEDNSDIVSRIESLEEKLENYDDICSLLDRVDVEDVETTANEAQEEAKDAKEQAESLANDVMSLQDDITSLTDEEKFAEKVRSALLSIASNKDEENG